MYLKSKIALTYNSGVNEQKSSTVIGSVLSFSRNGECTSFGADFRYSNGDIEPNEMIIQGAFHLNTIEEIDVVYQTVKADLPNTDDEPLYERTKNYLAFRLEMFQTFLPLNPSLLLTDIEIIS